MLVKRDDHRDGIVLPRIRNRLPDDLLVTEMHAIKHTDSETDFSAAGQ
jgi:hypothetical protein